MPTHQRKWFSSFWASLFTWRRARRTLIAIAMLATLLAAFYAEENWRGRRAWENCKRELEASGETIAWSAYVPPPVPDEQNIFKAPKMTEWFVRASWPKGEWQPGALSKRLGAASPSEFVHGANAVARVTIVPAQTEAAIPAADMLLKFSYHVLSLADSNSIFGNDRLIPLIKFQDVPLSVAITNLARQAGLDFAYDPKVLERWKSEWPSEPHITFTLENSSARAALMVLLEGYHLAWVEDGPDGFGRIVPVNTDRPQVLLQAEAAESLKAVLQAALDQSLPRKPVPEISEVRGRRFVAGPLPEIKTLRLAVVADRVPTALEVEGFLPHNVKLGGRIGWRAIATGSNTFNVFFIEETFYSAAEYLAWSDQFAPELAIIREGLQRPRAWIEADYQRPFSRPIVEFVAVRNIAQLLAERAQCCLVLGQPERALEELTLLHDLRKMLEGKPALLVSAMIDVAITGLYAEIVADGFRLNAWREPQLRALQSQLTQLNLPTLVDYALQAERAAVCQTFENLKPGEVAELMRGGDAKPGFFKRITDPAYVLLKFAPRGWLFQNLVTVAQIERSLTLGMLDPKTGVIHPRDSETINREIEKLNHFSPFNIVARRAVPNFTRAMQVTARNQSRANQAFIACGLEQFRAAKGKLPESLDALAPQFAARVPNDIMTGQPLKYRTNTNNTFTLYSVGWNGKDDGGEIVSGSNSADFDRGDWVWLSPAK